MKFRFNKCVTDYLKKYVQDYSGEHIDKNAILVGICMITSKKYPRLLGLNENMDKNAILLGICSCFLLVVTHLFKQND